MKILGILTLWLSVSQIQAKQGYLLTSPKALGLGDSEKFCLYLHDVIGPGKVSVQLVKESEIEDVIAETTVQYPRDGNCFTLDVPDDLDSYSGSFGILNITGEFLTNDNYTFESTLKVNLVKRSQVTFVQTDKAVYKPGQKVLFRVLTLNPSLQPALGVISLVAIYNPDNVRVAQWLNITNDDGLVQLHMQLSDEPTLGKWSIKVEYDNRKTVQYFEVQEYVLPKYTVEITPPTYLFPISDTATWKVCATYTYGKRVSGNLNINLKYKDSYYNRYNRHKDKYPVYKHNAKIDGCYNLTLKVDQMLWDKLAFLSKRLTLDAEVEEEGTGVKISESKELNLQQTPLNLHFEVDKHGSSFKPGLPYHGQLTATNVDKTPAVGELIGLCYELTFKVASGQKMDKICRNFTSDERGIVKFTVPPQPSNVNHMTLHATAILHESSFYYDRYFSSKMFQPTAFTSLQTWYSPSGSFLNIKGIPDAVGCNEMVPIDVYYTTDGQALTVNYQVMSRGTIVAEGHHQHHYRDGEFVKSDDYIVEELAKERNKRSVYPRYLSKTFKETSNYTLPKNIGHFEIKLNVNSEMSPISRIVVFYVRPDGETVAGDTTFDVKPCFHNNASLKFEKKSVYPGTNAAYTISASPNSLCALGAVDKSVHLLRSDNQLTSDKVFAAVKAFDVQRYTYGSQKNDDDYCSQKKQFTDLIEKKFKKGDKYYSTTFKDSLEAFERVGQSVSSNLDVENRLCSVYVSLKLPSTTAIPSNGTTGFSTTTQANSNRIRAPSRPLARPAPVAAFAQEDSLSVSNGAYGIGGSQSAVKTTAVNTAVEIRSYFPETWLWDLEKVGDKGYVKRSKDIPHTITEWVGSLFCTSATNGLGISPSATIKAFQPFFVSYTLPYSVVRGEKVPIIVSVFNYLDECLAIKTELTVTDEFKLLSGSNEHSMCVCGNQQSTHTFKILPTSLGKVNLTVHSHSFKDENGAVCGRDKKTSSTEARDAITKPLLVDPEGFPQETTQSVMFCPSENSDGIFKHDFTLDLPDDLVEGSARAYYSVSGDLMGPSIDGLEKLVTLPVGCGEQNMVRFTPNIYVLQYLENEGDASEPIRKKAIEYMKTGYQRELQYRRDDGSFSAFGKFDDEGSLWLTSFVVKSFDQARQFISIDDNIVKSGMAWIVRHQNESGCFPIVGMVHNSALKGGLGDNDPTALTAYVLISLLESKTGANKDVIDKGFECIVNGTKSDSYTLALSSYAAALNNDTELAQQLLDQLYKNAIVDGFKTYWPASSKSISIEIGSYAILTHTILGKLDNKAKALSVVRWITEQRNANGGFVSTQDTVVALQALSHYAKVSSVVQNLEIEGAANGFQEKYYIDKDNKLLLQRSKVSELPNIVDVRATGNGCGLAQVALKYNRRISNASEAWELTAAETEIRSYYARCNKRAIKICARYKLNENSNMAVVAVKMVSGYVPDKDSLKQLKNDKNLKLKRYEIDSNVVFFYFDYIGKEEKCFTFKVDREVKIENTKAATVSIYDYYASELKLDKSYNLNEACSSYPIRYYGN